eukprot:TRINITY_DN5322_c1_g2_i1.p3 TRINITY_DN5322_c1_g2~~TRINITY_DN5322_c1_g2_i1.p3  ORF type:complete len:190 (-),score=-17.09 TRINITY_DN5322_c1_g2_i1:511-1080(-)
MKITNIGTYTDLISATLKFQLNLGPIQFNMQLKNSTCKFQKTNFIQQQYIYLFVFCQYNQLIQQLKYVIKQHKIQQSLLLYNQLLSLSFKTLNCIKLVKYITIFNVKFNTYMYVNRQLPRSLTLIQYFNLHILTRDTNFQVQLMQLQKQTTTLLLKIQNNKDIILEINKSTFCTCPLNASMDSHRQSPQ